ncbi:MAG: CDP-alcohol phosphatidyltransferase family protein [Thermodesulfobacteriota bacterium]
MRFIPNILSSLRLVMAFVFPFAPENSWIWLVFASGCTDFLDGWIARRWQVASWQGGLLDAVADKTFVLVVLLSMAWAGKFSYWFIPVLLARDLTVAFTAAYASVLRLWHSFQEMDARWSGKIATAGQFLLFVVVLLFPAYTKLVLIVAVLFSSVASIDYGWLFVKALQDRARKMR